MKTTTVKPKSVFLFRYTQEGDGPSADYLANLKDYGLLSEFQAHRDTDCAFSYYQESEKNLDDFLVKFTRAAKKAKQLDAGLYVETFLPLQYSENRRLLKLLFEMEVDFKFFDFKSLDKNSLKSMIDFFELQSEHRKTQLKGAETKQSGNPNLTDPEIIEVATRQKKQRAYFNNQDARLIAVKMHEEGYSQNKIAADLNEKGFVTSKGKQFYAKQVSRFLEKFEEMRKYFLPSKRRERALDPQLDGAEADRKIPLVFDNGQDFENVIEFQFSSPLETGLKIEIYDNVSPKPVYTETFKGVRKKVTIDIMNDTYLYPGRHYVQFEAEGYQKINAWFTIHKSLVDLSQVTL